MPGHAENQRSTLTLLVGTKGAGKSTLLKSLLSRERHILMWDPMREHKDMEPPRGIVPLLQRSLDALELFQPLPERRQVLRESENFGLFLDYVSRARRYTIAVDEAHNVWNDRHGELEKHMRIMRHRKQSWFLLSHRVRHCPYAILALIDHVCIFRTPLVPDQNLLEEWFDVKPETVKHLGVGEYIRWEAWSE